MIRDVSLFFSYEVRNTLRNPIWPLFGIAQPVMYLLLFGPLFAGTRFDGRLGEALTSFAPGMLVITALFGTMSVAYGTIYELRSGVLERIAVSPVRRPAIVLGRMLRDVLVLIIQSSIVMLMAVVMGMRVSPAGLLLTLALLAVTGLFSAGVAYGLALSLRDENAMGQIMQFFALPLMLLSGALLPMAFGPSWLERVAWFTPFYHPVEAGRALFAGHFTDLSVPLAFAIMAALAALTVTWSVRSLRRLAG
ncbi:ABC transporter permease [Nonomuraea typhae]|uniref:ABC transporter permease n=1 Tax=Nonomuraea typhae TaxID=2603600 RepID=UPI0012FBDF62|nr:ABC transporter permease [Nonomuraea typhae]